MNRGLITAGDLSRDLQDKGFALFMQDDWRITPRFTVNAGLALRTHHRADRSQQPDGQFHSRSRHCCKPEAASSTRPSMAITITSRRALGSPGTSAETARPSSAAAAAFTIEQGSFDSFMAIGNLLGLRTIPTGVNLYANGNPTPTTAGGNINVGQITFTGPAWDRPPRPEPSNTGGRITVRVCRFILFLLLAAMAPSRCLRFYAAALYRPRRRSEPPHPVRGHL